ncbi:MAG: hypothetical protein P9X27_05210 [Candidatus Kaelpia aquatica]|nr:hypothetical protein [Candidatus Kaelpia aquatica]
MKNRDFYLAGRNISVTQLTFSLLATIVGASSTIGLMGFAYSVGAPAILWLIFGSLGLFLLSLVYSSFFLKSDNYTIAEFLGKKYGLGVRRIASWVIFLAWIGIIAAQLLALKKIIEIFIPELSSLMVVFLVTLFLAVYTIIGGQRAVIITDRVQFLLLILGFLAVNYIFIKQLDFSCLNKSCGYLKFPLNSNFSVRDLIYLALILVPVYFIGPDVHSRVFCSKDKNIIKKSLKMAALALLPISILIVSPALMLRNVFGVSDAPSILNLFFDILFNHSALFYVFLIALVSAILSSADSCLMTSATMFTHDILSLPEDKNVLYTRIVIFLVALLAFILSFYFENIISLLKASYSIYISGVFIPFLLIPFKDRLKIKNRAVFIGMLVSGSIGAVSAFSGFKAGVACSYLTSIFVICILSYLKK